MRERILAVLLAAAAGLVIVGAFQACDVAGFVVAGVLLAGWAWLIFGEVGE